MGRWISVEEARANAHGNVAWWNVTMHLLPHLRILDEEASGITSSSPPAPAPALASPLLAHSAGNTHNNNNNNNSNNHNQMVVEEKQYDPQGPPDRPVFLYDNGDMYLGGWTRMTTPPGTVTIPTDDTAEATNAADTSATGASQKPHGWGAYLSQRECVFVGQWERGRLHGPGQCVWLPRAPVWVANRDQESPIVAAAATTARTRGNTIQTTTPITTTTTPPAGLPFLYYGLFHHDTKRDPMARVILKDGTTRIGPWENDRPVGDFWRDHPTQAYTPVATMQSLLSFGGTGRYVPEPHAMREFYQPKIYVRTGHDDDHDDEDDDMRRRRRMHTHASSSFSSAVPCSVDDTDEPSITIRMKKYDSTVPPDIPTEIIPRRMREDTNNTTNTYDDDTIDDNGTHPTDTVCSGITMGTLLQVVEYPEEITAVRSSSRHPKNTMKNDTITQPASPPLPLHNTDDSPMATSPRRFQREKVHNDNNNINHHDDYDDNHRSPVQIRKTRTGDDLQAMIQAISKKGGGDGGRVVRDQEKAARAVATTNHDNDYFYYHHKNRNQRPLTNDHPPTIEESEGRNPQHGESYSSSFPSVMDDEEFVPNDRLMKIMGFVPKPPKNQITNKFGPDEEVPSSHSIVETFVVDHDTQQQQQQRGLIPRTESELVVLSEISSLSHDIDTECSSKRRDMTPSVMHVQEEMVRHSGVLPFPSPDEITKTYRSSIPTRNPTTDDDDEEAKPYGLLNQKGGDRFDSTQRLRGNRSESPQRKLVPRNKSKELVLDTTITTTNPPVMMMTRERSKHPTMYLTNNISQLSSHGMMDSTELPIARVPQQNNNETRVSRSPERLTREGLVQPTTNGITNSEAGNNADGTILRRRETLRIEPPEKRPPNNTAERKSKADLEREIALTLARYLEVSAKHDAALRAAEGEKRRPSSITTTTNVIPQVIVLDNLRASSHEKYRPVLGSDKEATAMVLSKEVVDDTQWKGEIKGGTDGALPSQYPEKRTSRINKKNHDAPVEPPRDSPLQTYTHLLSAKSGKDRDPSRQSYRKRLPDDPSISKSPSARNDPGLKTFPNGLGNSSNHRNPTDKKKEKRLSRVDRDGTTEPPRPSHHQRRGSEKNVPPQPVAKETWAASGGTNFSAMQPTRYTNESIADVSQSNEGRRRSSGRRVLLNQDLTMTPATVRGYH